MVKDSYKMLKIALQIDVIENLKPKSDSSLLIAQEALLRGHEVNFYYPKDILWSKDGVFARVKKLISIEPLKYLEQDLIRLDIYNIIWIRQEPPFNMEYITYTYFLEELEENGVIVVNKPSAIRNSPEKTIALKFKEFMPQTYITKSKSLINDLIERHKRIIVKPLHEFGGKSVFLLENSSFNNKAIIDALIDKYNEPLMLQEFLENVKDGDKRVLFIDGELMGGFLRVPKEGNLLANLVAGGTAIKTELNEKELKIATEIGTFLKKEGLFFVGIDIIDGYLTEINTTCPTGIASFKSLYNIDLSKKIWEKLEQKYNDRKNK